VAVPRIVVGGANATLSLESLRNSAFGPYFKGSNFNILISDGKLFVSMTFRDGDGKVVAEIINNEWKIKPSADFWDRNFNDTALEIVGANGDVIVQVVATGFGVSFQGLLRDTEGNGLLVSARSQTHNYKDFTPKERQQGSTDWARAARFEFIGKDQWSNSNPRPRIEKIFKYPSELHLSETLY
jgi:hypothetical protein